MKNIVLNKGHNIQIAGVPSKEIFPLTGLKTVSIIPTEFRDVKPKLLVKEGDKVELGSPLFFDKSKPDVRWASPACGSILSIQYGARRVVEKIEIKVEGFEAKSFNILTKNQLKSSDRKTILGLILKANLFPLIRQRPFNKIPDPKVFPRDIFISIVHTSPLAVDIESIVENFLNEFQAGVTGLSKLTDGSVYITSSKGIKFEDAESQRIAGPHPAGNVGIQIHHSKPIKPGDIVWTLDAQHVITLGKLFLTGNYDSSIIVSIGGSGATKPQTVKTVTGVSVKALIANQGLETPVRLISGDVLTGTTTDKEHFLGFYNSTLSIINDVVERPFMGMLSPGSTATKYSLTNTFIGLRNRLFNFNTSQNGELRAIVPLNAWENVLPMDIFPNVLYRAILAQDVEEMEQLGIWECDEEDFALCSFVCPSKIDVGAVIRDGLNLMEADG